jgi:signal transduction histidine kinase
VPLHQLFQNLIANAVKFAGNKPPRITLAAHRAGPDWQFTVRDEGIGIDPELTERIFEFGERGHAGEGRPGSGIGLAVCKRVVERHGGRIWAEPLEAGGSAFHFTLRAA